MGRVECVSDSEGERRHNDADPRPSADDDDDSEKDYGSQRVNLAMMHSNNGITEISETLSNSQKTSIRQPVQIRKFGSKPWTTKM